MEESRTETKEAADSRGAVSESPISQATRKAGGSRSLWMAGIDKSLEQNEEAEVQAEVQEDPVEVAQTFSRRIVMTDPKKPDSLYEESIKTLRTNLQFAGRGIRVILISSCYPNEGKSNITFQLAREIGNMGKRVLLLDTDIRKSTMVSRYQVRAKNICGLSHYLCGQADVESICYQTNFPNVDIIFAGPTVPNPSELLEDPAFSSLLSCLRENYDYVLLDTPPLGSVSDALIAAKWCDGVILVVESKLVSRKMLQRVKKQLEQTGCRILGAVLNKVDPDQDKYYNRYGYYKYEYKKDGNG